MIEIKEFTKTNQLSDSEISELSSFLFLQLGEYGDPKPAIKQAIRYSLGIDNKLGGSIFISRDQKQIIGAAVINKTGMEAYIPANILVYIATHKDYRGQGVGKALMQQILDSVEGDIALHVEPGNPAKGLYEKLGFTNKYLEMRLTREE